MTQASIVISLLAWHASVILDAGSADSMIVPVWMVRLSEFQVTFPGSAMVRSRAAPIVEWSWMVVPPFPSSG